MCSGLLQIARADSAARKGISARDVVNGMARTILKFAIVLILLALVWKLVLQDDGVEDVDRID